MLLYATGNHWKINGYANVLDVGVLLKGCAHSARAGLAAWPTLLIKLLAEGWAIATAEDRSSFIEREG